MKKLKIAFVYGKFCANGKKFDIPNLMNDPQGLTGSETSFFFFARALQHRGHNVNIYIDIGNKFEHYGSHFGDFDSTFDVVYIWNEPYYASLFKDNSLKLCNIQINDLDFFNCENKIDVYTSPSKHHKNYMESIYNKYNWEIINNAIEEDWFKYSIDRDPATLMYASSCDRGLHLLLQVYPDIKKAIPNVKLKIFYDFDKWYNIIMNTNNNIYETLEYKNRAKYIKYALEEMKDIFDIQHFKNISKKQICQEMLKATILAYPFSTPKYCEGFSCTVMEACAAGMIPVISNQDALGDIYGASAIMINSPIEKNLNDFTEKIIFVLTNKEIQQKTREKCIALSRQYHFSDVVVKLENLMYAKLNELGRGAR